MIRIIFISAFNQYTMEGCKLDTLDYLLEPFNYLEFLWTEIKRLVTPNSAGSVIGV